MSNTHTLAPGEPHPASDIALRYLRSRLCYPRVLEVQEALCSCAIEGNRLAQVCAETLRRLLDHEPVSDRYLMGLAWTVWSMEDVPTTAHDNIRRMQESMSAGQRPRDRSHTDGGVSLNPPPDAPC